MNHLLLLLPLLIPLFGAIFCYFCLRMVTVQKVIGLTAQLGLVFAAFRLLSTVDSEGIQVTQLGNWPAPFGISLVADLFSGLMLVAGSVTGLAILLYSFTGLNRKRQGYGYYPLLLLLQFGINGACLTGDLFNLFVWFEVLLICCFVLISFGSTKAQLEGSIKYVTINFLASGFLLMGIGIIYGITGTLNLAELGKLVQTENVNAGLITMASMFFLVALGIKAGLFPLFFWLPASYHTPPIAISAFIAGMLTKVGMYALIRLFTLVFIMNADYIHTILLVMAGFTMVIGVLGAASQTDFRKILSFHIVSQIGYMLMGLAIFTPLAIAGSVFFILHNIFVKTNLFLISGIVEQQNGSFSLKKLGGVYLQRPLLALLFVIAAFSLAGIPPLSGFWGKFMLAKAGFEAGNTGIVITSLIVSLLTTFSMTKIWNEVFWKDKPPVVIYPAEKTETVIAAQKPDKWLYVPVVLLTCVILFMGLYAEALVSLAMRAAGQLLHTETYINAVLNP
ncbi:proton-conducting transporter membrane subunit [Adhaeribacter terreus]|uniref:Proton-conducting transporter membrane subunit n=1 Tax=Adhaeribacter terreus TaxID=529703 RepID=A0ABW0EF48_9BACT